MPITYVICFLTAYYGPNAKILGNIKASIWHYRAVAEPVAYLQNIFIFFLVDFSSGVINGILLWTTCKINVFTVVKNMQKTFWLIWATQEAALYLEVKIKLPMCKNSTLARFIWNAEISVSVAIHCYERLF